MIVKGKTKSGFKYEIESKVLSSWSFVKALKAADQKGTSDTEKMYGVIDMVELALGVEGCEALQEHLFNQLPDEEKAGGVPAKMMMDEMQEILAKLGSAEKNSAPSPQ